MAGQPGDIFAPIKGAARVWAVAAIHGQAQQLRDLHARLWTRFTRGDRLVYLGNYLGHGVDIPGTMDELLNFRRRVLTRPGLEPEDIVYLRGAQEEMWHKLLQIQFTFEPDRVLGWMLEQGVGATLGAYGSRPEEARARFRQGTLAVTRWTAELRANVQAHPGHDDLLGALRRAAFTEDGSLLFVHAGVDPHRPLSEQGDTLWWGSGYFSAMEGPYAGFKLIVRGYDRRRHGPRFARFAASIDGGCGFGGPLIAACFAPDGALEEQIEA